MTSLSIRNLIYFLLALIIAIGLSTALSVMLNIKIWTSEFCICCAAGAAIYFTGYRTANLTKSFTITEYLQKLKPIECDLVATEATQWAIIKRKREKDEEKKLQAEIITSLAKIRRAIDDSEKEEKK